MGKRYDWKVTPQNTPRFKERRILFLTAMGIFILNLLLTGIFLSKALKWSIIVAFISALFTVAQCFDIRREMWTWGYVIYDYKGFVDNMVKCKLNTLIVWNDYLPLNIKA